MVWMIARFAMTDDHGTQFNTASDYLKEPVKQQHSGRYLVASVLQMMQHNDKSLHKQRLQST